MEENKSRIGIMVLALKLGAKILPALMKILKSAKFIKAGLAVTSFAAYAYLLTWQFATVIMIALFVHESGHVWAMRRRNIKTKGFYFIPCIGGAAVPSEAFKTREDEAYVAIMGPVWGFGLALLVLILYFFSGMPMLAAAASWMAMINLLNLLPINPLDGGRIIKSIVFSASQGTSEKKRQGIVIAYMAMSILIIGGIALSGLYLILYFGVIGLFESLTYLKKPKLDVQSMTKHAIWRYISYFLILAIVLYFIMYFTEHIPGADISMQFLQDK